MSQVKVVVLGAGVIGLSVAKLLSKLPRYSVLILAEHMPGDYDIKYASPWAGANYLPTGAEGSNLAQFEKATWPHFEKMASSMPEAGVHFQENRLYNRKKDADTPFATFQKELLRSDPWYSKVVPNFRILDKSELPPGIDSGSSFTSVCINTAIYLPWLMSEALKSGATVRRGVLTHVSEAATLHPSGSKADIVINATGMGSKTLGGVEDKLMYPARAQIAVVRNDPGIMMGTSGTDDGTEEVLYVMHRAAGGGTVIGGCYQKGNWESQVDINLATRILTRAVKFCPSLVGQEGVKGLGIEPATPADVATGKAGIEKISVIRHGVGLRPVREGGPRVESENVDGLRVVHAYGHGGGGYQSSWGTAEEVVRLVEEAAGAK